MYRLDTDFVAPDHADPFVIAALAAASFGLTISRFVSVGPGGGNPNVVFDGPKEALERLVRDWYAPGDELMQEEQIGFIKLAH
jgi:hypothetical protein